MLPAPGHCYLQLCRVNTIPADKQKLSVGCECTFFKAKPSWSVLSQENTLRQREGGHKREEKQEHGEQG